MDGALSATGRGIRSIVSGSAWRGLASAWFAYFRDPSAGIRSLAPADVRAFVALGVAALLGGLSISVALAPYAGIGTARAAVAAVTALMWATARLAIFAYLAPPGAAEPHRLRAAWAGGVLPYAVALTPLTRAAAFGASAVLSYRGLVGAGIVRRDVTRLCAIGFGAELLAASAAWVAANGLVFIPALVR